MNKLFVPNEEFGQIIPDLKINGKDAPYPVVNDRAVRATAGIMLFIGVFTFFYTFSTWDFTMLKFVLPTFFLDFLLKVSRGPKYSIYGFLSRPLISNQKPEYCGAIQKRFAWSIGLSVSSIMILLIFVLKMETIVPLLICALCLFMMWLESTMGICVGCYIYNGLIKAGIVKRPKFHPACPGGVCDTEDVEMIEMH
ncbi:MAG: DUF4395 domain-containing protein [Candidatus Pacebacteria bacterium]|nr:DUF4395 domain-containing protein [Candidatus Paceibacterota bacterium]